MPNKWNPTPEELQDLWKYRTEYRFSYAKIASIFDHGERTIRRVLGKISISPQKRVQLTAAVSTDLAKAELKREIAEAKVEAKHAPPFKGRLLEW